MRNPPHGALWLLAIMACGPTDPTAGAPRDPDGGPGVCCPIDSGTCDGFRAGGWAPSLAQCTQTVDAAPPVRTVIDEHGCPRLIAEGSCLDRSDAGADR
ncbi:MAG: hypothetical protein U0324_07485 [Polyangiales bacterium]